MLGRQTYALSIPCYWEATCSAAARVQVGRPPRDVPWDPAQVTQHRRPLLATYVTRQSRLQRWRLDAFPVTWELKKQARAAL